MEQWYNRPRRVPEFSELNRMLWKLDKEVSDLKKNSDMKLKLFMTTQIAMLEKCQKKFIEKKFQEIEQQLKKALYKRTIKEVKMQISELMRTLRQKIDSLREEVTIIQMQVDVQAIELRRRFPSTGQQTPD